MTHQNIWLATIVIGVILIILTGIIFPIFPQEMAIPKGIETPVYAFEFARSYSDLIAVFGQIDDPLRADRIEAMNRGNRVDFIYMTIYSVYIALFFYASYLKDKRTMWLVFAAFGIGAGVFDAVENVILLSLTADLEASENLLWLKYPVHLKFTALYLCCFGFGMILKNSVSRVFQLLGLSIQTLSIGAIILMFAGMGAIATLVISIAWILQFIVAIKEYQDIKVSNLIKA